MPYIVDPILFPSGIVARIVSASCDGVNSKPDSVDPHHQAQLWLQEIESSQITKAKIAARKGISRARVTQVMNLLELPEAIQDWPNQTGFSAILRHFRPANLGPLEP